MTEETQEPLERPLFAQKARDEMMRAHGFMTPEQFLEHALGAAELAAMLRHRLNERIEEALWLNKTLAVVIKTDIDRCRLIRNAANAASLGHLRAAVTAIQDLAKIDLSEPHEFDPAEYEPFMAIEFDDGGTVEKEPA